MLSMQTPRPHLLTGGLEQDPGIYTSTNRFPYKGSRDHSLRTWRADESVSTDRGLGTTV